ncbi:MAG: ATP synthase F1 subunit gamma [Rubrobacter sp.]|nr:ATP synthase F1 subunit gamma [Rubrobacter sp.]
MASLRDLKRQIQSIDNISKVTGALQTVYGVKFRRAEARVGRARPYADNMQQMMQDIASKGAGNNPLLTGRGESRKVAIVAMTADRGLCGGFNAQLLRRTNRFRQEFSGPELEQIAVGRKAISFFSFRRVSLMETFSGITEEPTYEDAQRIGRYLTSVFEEEEADEVYLVYNRFQSAMVQIPTVTRLLPAAPEQDEQEETADSHGGIGIPFEFVPDADSLLDSLVPRYVETVIFQALLETAVGQHGARMTAMKSATDNANELSDRLTLQMNKARQAQITQEILEIAGGAEALSTG